MSIDHSNVIKPSQITFNKNSITLKPEESVLEALLREGHAIPNSCRAGACQCCLMQVTPEGKTRLPASSQQGLTSPEKELGYFLSCSCIPSDPITVQLLSKASDVAITTKITEVRPLNKTILRVRFSAPLDYRPGQYLNLLFTDDAGVQHTRSYSVASVPELDQTTVELHIKTYENGVFGQWIKGSSVQNQNIEIQGPLGHCFYSDSLAHNNTNTLLLAGLGTGLAPLYGIVRDALNQGFDKSIHLVAGARNSNDIYLIEELNKLEKQFPNLHVSLVALEGEEYEGIKIENIYDFCKNLDIDFSKTHAFLCGAQSFVGKLKKQLFLSGTPMKSIMSDPFLPAKNP